MAGRVSIGREQRRRARCGRVLHRTRFHCSLRGQVLRAPFTRPVQAGFFVAFMPNERLFAPYPIDPWLMRCLHEIKPTQETFTR